MEKVIMLICTLFIIGCGGQSQDLETGNSVKLSKEEVEVAGNDQNMIAQFLIKNAILREKEVITFTKEEEKRLENLKDNLELEFFIEKNSVNGTEANPLEILKVYEDNKDKFNGTKLEVVAPQIEQLIINQKLQKNKIRYINEIIAKYDLNAKLKEYSGNEDGKIDPEKDGELNQNKQAEDIEVRDLEIKE